MSLATGLAALAITVGCARPEVAHDATPVDAGIDADPTLGTLALTWAVFEGGQPSTCPPSTSATLWAHLGDEERGPYDFPCEAGAGTVGLPGGEHLLSFAYRDAVTGEVRARFDGLAVLVVPLREQPVHFDLDLQGLLFTSWDLYPAGGGGPLGCADVPNGGVRVAVTPAGGGAARTRTFSCEDGSTNMRVWFPGIPVGDHVVTHALLGPSGPVIAESEAVAITIEHGTHIVELLDRPILVP